MRTINLGSSKRGGVSSSNKFQKHSARAKLRAPLGYFDKYV